MANYNEIEQLKIDMAAKKYAQDTNGDLNRNYVAFQKGADFIRSSKDEFTIGFADFLRDNAEIKPINNFMNGYYYNGNVTKIEELLTIYKDSLNKPEGEV